jgi:ribonuclease HI
MGRNRSHNHKRKQSQQPVRDKRRLRRGLSDIWMDGSYLEAENKAGAAAVICSAKGHKQRIISFELSHLPVRISADAELWAAIHILESQPAGAIGRLNADCTTVTNRIERLRKGEGGKFNDNPIIIERLDAAIKAHPHMALHQVKRNTGHIPLADRFAKFAAKGGGDTKLEKLKRVVRGLPCAFTASPTQDASL